MRLIVNKWFLLFSFFILAYSDCPDLIHIDYTDYYIKYTPFKFINRNFTVVPSQGDYKNAIYDDEIINKKVDNFFDIIQNNNINLFLDDDISPKIIVNSDLSIIKPENFDFQAVIQQKMSPTEMLYALPKCHIRDKIPYPVFFTLINGSEDCRILDNGNDESDNSYGLNIIARRFYNNDDDLPWFFNPPNYNSKNMEECPPLLKNKKYQKEMTELNENEITDRTIIKNKIDNLFSEDYDNIKINCLENYAYPTIFHLKEDIILNTENFNLVKLEMEIFDKDIRYKVIAEPKCHLRSEIPYPIYIIYDTFTNLNKKEMIISYYSI